MNTEIQDSESEGQGEENEKKGGFPFWILPVGMIAFIVLNVLNTFSEDSRILRKARAYHKSNCSVPMTSDEKAAMYKRWDDERLAGALAGDECAYVALERFGKSKEDKREARRFWRWIDGKPVFVQEGWR